MWRQRLRVKTGCFRCRARRKKCDELKPVCGACRRWDFVCTWLRPTKDRAVEVLPFRRLAGIPRAVNGHGFPAFRDQTQLSLLRDFGSVYQGLVSPLASSTYRNVAPLFIIALDAAWIRDALNAFTSCVLYAQTRDDGWKGLVLSSYQTAVIGMKNRLSYPVQYGQELDILVAATFLGAIELIGTGNAGHALGHFALVARLGQPLFARPCSDQNILAVYRIILEGVIYNLAYQSLFIAVPDVVLKAIDWAHYDRIFRQPPGSGDPDYQLSPHLGGNHDIYRLILQITCFGRQSHDRETRASQVHRWLWQVEHLERRLDTYYVGTPSTVATLYTAKYQLFSLALRIYCLKVRDHSLRAWHSAIVVQVRKAQRILMHSNLAESANPVLAWPLIVFLCACPDYVTFRFMCHEVEEFRSNFEIGSLRQIETVVSILRRRHRREVLGVQAAEPDNLGILLWKKGITGDCY